MAKGKSAKKPTDGRQLLLRNRKARHEFEVLDRFEAGVALVGSEVKSLRQKSAQFGDSFAAFEGDELILQRLHIDEYVQANQNNHDPLRPRKLLLHKQELNRIKGKIRESGLTIVPLEIYFLGRYIKVELGICRGKKAHDKRADMKARDAKKEMKQHV